MRIGEGQDAYGQAIRDGWHTGEGFEVVERDDGFIGLSGGPGRYLADYSAWEPSEKRAVRFARGRVLDVGCGGGRVALRLQERGREVVAIDVSPKAVEVCRLRGVRDARVLSVTGVSRKLGRFDSIVMFGNNLGLLGGRRRGRWLLRRFHAITGERGRILAESTDPRATDDPGHLAYHERNLARGRMPGQLRIRVRYRTLATPWFDYLLVSREELEELARGTGWKLGRVFEGDGASYVAMLVKA